MKKLVEKLDKPQIIAWLTVLLVAGIIYLIIHLGKSALGLDFIFHDKLALEDERRTWVWILVLFPFVIVLGTFLLGAALSRLTKWVTFLGIWASYAALTGQIILSMSGAWLLIFPLVLPLQPLERWLGLNKTGFLPIRGTLAQDTIVPILIALGFAITIVGLAQVVIAARRKNLVTHGLYATMRHPQHLGIIIWALGFALWGSHYLDFLIWFTLVYVLVLLAWHEEGNLEKRFSTTYNDYQQNTLFMVPFIPKKGVLFQISSGKDVVILAGTYLIGIAIIFCVFYFFSVSWSPSLGHS